MLTAILGLLPTLVSGVKEYVGKKQDLQKLKRQSDIRKEEARTEAEIRRIESADAADVHLDGLSVQNAGWKDEYLLILTTFPIACLMLSPFVDIAVAYHFESLHYTKGMLAEGIAQGFQSMRDDVPVYYWYALAAVYVDSLGMRRMVRQLIDKFGGFALPFGKK